MKKQLLQWPSFIALCLIMLLISCSEKDEAVKINYLQLTAQQTSLNEDSETPLEVQLMLAFSPQKSTTIHLELEGNNDGIVEIEPQTVTFAVGEKTKTLRIKSLNKNILVENRSMSLFMKSTDDSNIQPIEPLTFSVKPSVGIEPLTDAQRQLIETYQKNTGIDLLSVLGKIKGEATVTFQLNDKVLFNSNQDTRTINGQTIIALGDDATASHMTLKMKSNPLLVTDFFYELLKKVTTQDVNEAWYDQPYPQAISKAIMLDNDKETFDMTLDNIVLNNDGTLSFTGEKTGTMNSDPIIGVPFIYNYSAWNRLKKMAADGGKTVVNDGDSQAEYSLTELINGGGSLDPNDYFFQTDIDTDGWENESSLWLKPNAHLDIKAGTLSFEFPFDFTNGNGYSKIKVIYQLKK